MATLPTAEDAAKYIINRMVKDGLRPEQGNLQKNINFWFMGNGWQSSDYEAGAKLAIERGWLKIGQNDFLMLTQAGFEAAD